MMRGTARVRRTLILLLTLIVVAPLAIAAVPAPSAAGASAATSTPVLGDYSGAILRPAGSDDVRRIDAPATISALQGANVNTYAYMIFGYGEANVAPTTDQQARDVAARKVTTAQWQDLPAFLAAAQTAGIDVWVYLVPPSESYAGGKGVPVPNRVSTYGPFDWNYHTWAIQIATLAADYPNLRAIAIDDFGGNTAEWGSQYSFRFTKPYVADMLADAREIAPWLELYPVLYYFQFHGNFAISSYYRDVVDGYVSVYNGSTSSADPNPPNTTDASLADSYSRITSSMTKCHVGNGCLQLGVPADTQTETGWYASVAQTVTVQSASTRTISFWANDDWIAGRSGVGFHYLQVLVDGQVVWQKDVAAHTGWTRYTADVTAALAGKSTATLTIRLYEMSAVTNFHVSAWFDAISATGFTVANPGFEGSLQGWTRLESRAFFDESWVPNADFFVLVYASKLGSESVPTTASYVRAVTDVGLDLTRLGLADGTLLYNLNLTGRPNGLGDPNAIDEVADLYGNYP